MAESLGTKTVKGTIWSAIDRFGVMGLQFAVNLVLARLLTPDDFGAIGMLSIFIAVSQTFIDGGFGSALIQKKNPTEFDYSTIFYWNIFIGIIIYIVLFITAPSIADFYRMPILSEVLRFLGLSLILNSIVGLQVNRLQKQLRFNVIAFTNIISYVISAGISVGMALFDMGIWSLVSMALSQPTLRSVIVFGITRWYPKKHFSTQSFKDLISFGGFLLLSNLLENICKNLQGLIIGRKFTADQMGYYSQADKVNQIVSLSIPQVIASVMYPVFSQFQDNKERLRELIKLDLRIISFVIYPLLTLLIVIADPLIKFLYGNNWIPCIPYFQILCCGGFFYALNNIVYYAVAACGKSKALFNLSFYKWSMFGLFLLIGMNFGMTGIMWAISISYLNIFIANCILVKKYTQLNIKSIFGSILLSLILSITCGLIIFIIEYHYAISWILISSLYVSLYIGIAYVLQLKVLYQILEILKKIKE